jgi:hypothetical protein
MLDHNDNRQYKGQTNHLRNKKIIGTTQKADIWLRKALCDACSFSSVVIELP